jgi:hypothetical protein
MVAYQILGPIFAGTYLPTRLRQCPPMNRDMHRSNQCAEEK